MKVLLLVTVVINCKNNFSTPINSPLKCFVVATFGKTPPEVDLPNLGKIQGIFGKSLHARSFFSFEGVPYARPPVGQYRFKEPEPVKAWNGILKAKTVYKCMQYSQFVPPEQDPVIGDEDCLYLNIYTPTLDQNAKLDVIVHIHGGAFMYNWGAAQGPEYILDKDVVYINFNYRLGPLGFLSTENQVVPGNNGVKDQILALKWIKDNVKYFGGNPDSVTITGVSAGGASVHVHYLSRKSRGLFHRGFSQSGTSLCPWVLMEKPLEKSKKLAASLGCPTQHVNNMIECLKTRPGRQIVGTAEFYIDQQYLTDIDTRWNELIPLILDYNYTVDAKLHDEVSQKIRKHYLGNRRVSRQTFKDFIPIVSDRIFVIDIQKTIQLQASITKSSVYSYYFTYRGAHSLSETISGSTEDFGASHTDDTSHVFKMDTADTTTTQEDRKMINVFLEMVTSFAKTGKPKVPGDWPQVPKNNKQPFTYLRIDSPTEFSVETGVSENATFWNSNFSRNTSFGKFTKFGTNSRKFWEKFKRKKILVIRRSSFCTSSSWEIQIQRTRTSEAMEWGPEG
ncbi:COesterase and/or Abhydrolase 3 domain containing protein [Asbolus verrucosus]|uniref:Carboxylic ester hydrolase n=1 Tax=Asbolus verrucosus TaxID=1661398 RepID=A0A482W815_ASBVE|nr:COesterase and/or Abhydrolase 3 domain containing protein [Asbolus verrucosus]